MRQFMRFMLGKVYQGQGLEVPGQLLDDALEQTIADVRHHLPVSGEEVARRVTANQSELAVFLYRLGHGVRQQAPERADLLGALHWLMRSCCACEIYFSNQIGPGFYVVHGVGTVIGSRNTIGVGFRVYQGCTIGHLKTGQAGCVIGERVTMFAGASVLGPVSIGDDVVIGAGCQITSDVPAGTTCLANLTQRRRPRNQRSALSEKGTS